MGNENLPPQAKKGVANESRKCNFPSDGNFGRKGQYQTRVMACDTLGDGLPTFKNWLTVPNI